MAQPFDSAITQQTVSNILQTQYLDKVLLWPYMNGSVTNRLVQPMDHAIVGAGEEWKFKRWGGDHVRISNDALPDFDTAQPFDVQTITVRWNERDPSSNDFTHLSASGRVSDYQFDSADSEGAILDIVETINGDIRDDYNWSLAALRRIPRSGQIGLQNGTAKNNDHGLFASCTAYTASATSVRIQVDNTSLPLFRKGKLYDLYSSGGALQISNIRCTDTQPTDTSSGSQGSVAFEIVTGKSSVANFGATASTYFGDNAIFYVAGSKNKAMYSVEAWMTSPTSSDSFIGGRNRSQSAYQGLMPTLTRASDTASKISKDMFDVAGTSLAFVAENANMTRVALANPRLISALKAQYDAAAFVTWPSTDDREKRFGNLGSMGVNIQEPTLGTIKLVGDPFMVPDHVDLMVMGTWWQGYRGAKGLKILPGEKGMWYRMQSATAGAGKSMYWQMDAYANLVDLCNNPRVNCRIQNVTT